MSSSAERDAARSLDQRQFDEWPASLRALFDGTALASKIGFSASLITSDPGGYLRTSLLGIGELYAPDSRTLAFALWPTSRAARTLASPDHSVTPTPGYPLSHETHAWGARHHHGRAHAALTFVHDAAFYQVQLAVEPLQNADAKGESAGGNRNRNGNDGGSGLALFLASIDAGEIQRVGYARLTGGITFELSGDASGHNQVLDRWQRQLVRLRQAAHARLAADGGRPDQAGDQPR